MQELSLMLHFVPHWCLVDADGLKYLHARGADACVILDILKLYGVQFMITVTKLWLINGIGNNSHLWATFQFQIRAP